MLNKLSASAENPNPIVKQFVSGGDGPAAPYKPDCRNAYEIPKMTDNIRTMVYDSFSLLTWRGITTSKKVITVLSPNVNVSLMCYEIFCMAKNTKAWTPNMGALTAISKAKDGL